MEEFKVTLVETPTIYIPHGAPLHPPSRDCPQCEISRLTARVAELEDALDREGMVKNEVIARLGGERDRLRAALELAKDRLSGHGGVLAAIDEALAGAADELKCPKCGGKLTAPSKGRIGCQKCDWSKEVNRHTYIEDMRAYAKETNWPELVAAADQLEGKIKCVSVSGGGSGGGCTSQTFAVEVQPVEEMTEEQKALRVSPAITVTLPETVFCGLPHPQAPHVKCTLKKGHADMHTADGMLMWDMAR